MFLVNLNLWGVFTSTFYKIRKIVGGIATCYIKGNDIVRQKYKFQKITHTKNKSPLIILRLSIFCHIKLIIFNISIMWISIVWNFLISVRHNLEKYW